MPRFIISRVFYDKTSDPMWPTAVHRETTVREGLTAERARVAYEQDVISQRHLIHAVSPVELPPGCEWQAWESAKEGQLVWVAGTHNGTATAYGPHTVIDPVSRRLKNAKNMVLRHMAEDLVVPRGHVQGTVTVSHIERTTS